ncbi:MAG: hypothetical protein ABI690_15080 [Chloroflexota bacterium]
MNAIIPVGQTDIVAADQNPAAVYLAGLPSDTPSPGETGSP